MCTYKTSVANPVENRQANVTQTRPENLFIPRALAIGGLRIFSPAFSSPHLIQSQDSPFSPLATSVSHPSRRHTNSCCSNRTKTATNPNYAHILFLWHMIFWRLRNKTKHVPDVMITLKNRSSAYKTLVDAYFSRLFDAAVNTNNDNIEKRNASQGTNAK